MEPQIDKDTFKQIFRDHWNSFTATYPLLYSTGNLCAGYKHAEL